MLDKTILIDYCDLEGEIKDLENKIDLLNKTGGTYESDLVKGSSNCFPYTAMTYRLDGYHVADPKKREKKLKELSIIYQNRCDELLEQKMKTEKMISKVKSSTTRKILEYRYMDGLTWDEVSARFQGKYSVEALKKRNKRFFEKV